ncbi:mechanosensitive ion channel protein MscS [Ruegeria sp. AD91A]|uniref:mechanosensitive ion channel family protein n=1 Tax=Ruegeria sp. AD91A TaxID=2293862 RepID=UPI000E53B866|nr:mechanosensitive ion channel domain-containing protein [Ruegeria sp. AD91A]AXT27508.1 mechanosensitive ion channel protein MscS [Ruegeria sp. AD91A]
MRAFLVWFTTVLFASSVALAQSEEPLVATEEREDPEFVAPVIVDGEELFVVRGSSALPATERADKVAERLSEVGDASQSSSINVEIIDSEFGKLIRADGQMITTTTQADAEYEQMDVESLAALQAEAIETAILQYREARSNEGLVDSAIAAVAWTVIFALVSYGFFAKRRKLLDYIRNNLEKRAEGFEEATKSILRSKAIASIIVYAIHVLMWVFFLFFFYYYLSLVLLSFAETQGIAQILLKYVSEPLVTVVLAIVGYIPNLIMLAIIAAVTRLGIRGLDLFFENIESGAFELKDFEDHWIAPTKMLCRALFIVIALVFAYPYIPGSDSRAFQGLTILAGIMVSLGSNTVVSNMMAGLFVIYRRSTNVGDRIQVGDKIGDVTEIKLMETLIKSIKNEMISIPNAQLLNSEVVNYSRKVDGRGLLVHTTVGIGYEEPPKKIKAMLIEAAHRTQGLRKSPEPFVLWTQLADYAINYEINAYTSRGSSLPKILSDLRENIVDVFNENETQIMTPSYIADPPEPKIPSADWDGELAHISD